MPASGLSVSVADVVTRFRTSLDGDDADERDPLLDALVQLHRTNLAQWRLEDTTRAPDASDAVVAKAKRGIDALNLRRHQCVETVDALIGSVIAPASSAPPATESPAMAFDRLSVMVIRIHYTESAAEASTSGPAVYRERLPGLYRRLDVLTTALQALLDDARDGTRSYLPYEHLKLYESPTG
jgi:Protein of unknown function (DUF4254)